MSLPRRTCSLAIAALTAAVVAGCGGGGDGATTAAAPATTAPSSASAKAAGGITIDNFAFTPKALTAGAGSVDVTNDDSTAHTVTADDGSSFDTGPVDAGSSATFTITKPGRYPYHCAIHPNMHGTLTVQ